MILQREAIPQFNCCRLSFLITGAGFSPLLSSSLLPAENRAFGRLNFEKYSRLINVMINQCF